MSSIKKAVVARWSYSYWNFSSIYQDNRTQSLYSIGAIEDLETFDDSRLRRNFASVICEGRCKASVVEHSLLLDLHRDFNMELRCYLLL